MKRHYLFLRKIAPTGGWGGLEKLLLNWFREIDYRKFKISLAVTQGKEEIFLKEINRFNLPVKISVFGLDGRK